MTGYLNCIERKVIVYGRTVELTFALMEMFVGACLELLSTGNEVAWDESTK